MRSLLAPTLALALTPALASAQECRLAFTVEVTQGAGDIRPGETLTGQAAFRTTGRDLPGEAGITVHLATGDMTLDPDIRGELWAVVTTSGNPVADLIAVHARDVEGFTVAGLRYAGPMTITLYGHPGTLPAPVIPTAQPAWDAMTLSRRFALHAQGYDRVAGDVTALTVACDPPTLIDSRAESP
jgi:antitoxin (DNA-binding transcriptional repressor) of toxin-antitoxin stability system